MSRLTRLSPAKINLTLRVCRLRPDGYHEIESLVARVDLCDTVTVARRDDGHCSVECDDSSVPCDERNLALQAARKLAEVVGVQRGAHIHIVKRIPPGAGLGGGSSNAATTLTLLNDLWGVGLSRDGLAAIGTHVGSDVPLFFREPLCVLRGRGEIVEDCDRRLDLWATLILPDLHSSTAGVYALFDRLPAPPSRPAIGEVLAAAGSASSLMAVHFNDLEPAACAATPGLADLIKRVQHMGGNRVAMTGSGAALFRLFDDAPAAAGYAERVRKALSVRVEVVHVARA